MTFESNSAFNKEAIRLRESIRKFEQEGPPKAAVNPPPEMEKIANTSEAEYHLSEALRAVEDLELAAPGLRRELATIHDSIEDAQNSLLY